MGLSIKSKSSKRYSYGYNMIHQIRWLSLVHLGLPLKFNGESSFILYNGFDRDKLVNLYSSIDDTSNISIWSLDWWFKCAGYYFPNLHFHSDSEGTYTKNGKLFGGKLLTGNSVKLLKELTILVNSERVKQIKEDHPIYKALVEFYELVKDVVENYDGKIDFG